MAKDLQVTMLLDCYGEFLTPHQRQMAKLYYEADLSLGEIAGLLGITRQGVHDGIRRGEQTLQQMEEKLHFAEKLRALRQNYEALADCLEALEPLASQQAEAQEQIRKAKELLQQGQELF